ncbi:MAG: outer membrane protein assembly factor BamA [Halobacteriovoraceae bacterium]|jgi:outer membrane protein insertion porin family|nr:outer membrane protein assembly factor BamA [Halobacteriovoraceae bacterium]
MIIRYLLFFVFLFHSYLSFSESSLGEHQSLFKVDAIEIEGNKKVEAEAIIEKMKVEKGKVLDNYTLRNDIKKIYEMRYFESVEAHKKVVKGKNILVMKIVEKPIISKISFEGNDEISGDDLDEQIKTKEYNILDVNTIKADVLLLQKFYEEKGFYLANIDYDLIKNEFGGLDLVFRVKEFDKVRVKKIMFLGNHEISDEDLKVFMHTQEETLFSGLSGSGSFKEFYFKTDVEKLKYLYKTRGYLQVNIGNPVITVSEDKKWIFITIDVKEGPKFSVNDIFFNGELLFTETEMRDEIKLISEEIYSEETLRKDIQTLTEMYQDKGYAFANVLRRLEIVPGENKVDIHYSFEKGNIAYFGKIIVKGNTKTRDKVVRRELRVYEGMRYSGSLLRKSKENVNRLGFFEPGSVIFNTVSPRGKDDVLDVEVSVKERQTGQISLGAGYSTATKGFFQASIAQNNFRGLGQNLNLQVSLSENQKTYNLGFTEPYFLDSKWTAGADIYKSQNGLISSFSSEKYGGDIRVGYPIFEYTRLFLTLRHEVTDIEDVRNPTIDLDTENGTAASIKSTLRYDRRNNIFEPTEGHYASMSVEEAGLYGDKYWLKTTLEGRFYKPVYEELVFRSRLKLDQIMKTRSNKNIPRTEKYQMGGSRNMRGYNYEDIGPQIVDADKQSGVITQFNAGGQFSVLSQFELEHPLIKEAGLKWVLFYDAGNVYQEAFEADKFVLKQDYGFGFRWFSPIGVLRFEFGYPIDPIDGQDGQQFHFDIGQLF